MNCKLTIGDCRLGIVVALAVVLAFGGLKPAATGGVTPPAPPPALDDTGLVFRTYLDQAASGTGPTQCDDSSSNAYHLTEINYGSGNMAWTEVSGNRGLESTSTTGTQRCRRSIDNTSDAFRDAIHGSKTATVEIVFDLHAGNANGARIFAVNNRSGAASRLGLLTFTTTTIRVQVNGTSAFSPADTAITSGRHVYHFVVDTNGATTRCRLYEDGTELVNSACLAQDAVIDLTTNVDLIAFNRENSGSFDRPFDGWLGYAAVYNVAFDATRASNHSTHLNTSDDTPSGAPRPARRRIMVIGSNSITLHRADLRPPLFLYRTAYTDLELGACEAWKPSCSIPSLVWRLLWC